MLAVSPHVISIVGRTGKKGSDKGIDGIKVFVDDNSGKAKRVIVQVKSGHVKSGDIRDLVGTLDREGGANGVFITLEKATSHMTDEPPQPVSSPPNISASSPESKY